MTDDVKRPRKPHPMQPIVIATDKVARFQQNKVVRFLLDFASERGCGMNTLATMDFAREDHEQFAMLIGYSVSGAGDLSYFNKKRIREADEQVARIARKGRR